MSGVSKSIALEIALPPVYPPIIKFMKPSKFRVSLLTLAAIAFAPTSHAMLLVGWYDFDNTSGDEAADVTATGFSGNLTKNTDSRSTGGDTGAGAPSGIFYGNSTIPSGTDNDGAVRLAHGSGSATFSMINTSGAAISLANLLFDATATNSSSVLELVYRIGTNPFSLPVTFTGLNPTGSTAAGAQADYTDLAFSLVGITVGNGQTIDFSFSIPNGTTGGRLDNIAITAIPEPASVIALSLILGSGLFLRKRQSQPALCQA